MKEDELKDIIYLCSRIKDLEDIISYKNKMLERRKDIIFNQTRKITIFKNFILDEISISKPFSKQEKLLIKILDRIKRLEIGVEE